MFAVDDIDGTLERLRKRRAKLVGRSSPNIKTRIGSATSEGLKDFSSDSPKNSAERRYYNAMRPHSILGYLAPLIKNG
jgi:hypothetical protein